MSDGSRALVDELDRMVESLDRNPHQPSAAASTVEGHPWTELATRLAEGPRPRASLLALRRLAEDLPHRGPDAGGCEAMAAVLSAGPELPRLLAADPTRLQVLLDPGLGQPWGDRRLAEALDRRLEGADDDEAAALGIARFHNDQLVRLAACEFGAGTLEQVGQQLARVADLCIDRALHHAVAQTSQTVGAPRVDGRDLGPTAGLAVIAMGKHGAEELNFCSDIDVVFVYPSDNGTAGRLTLHEFYARVCQRITRLLSAQTADGRAFRVDLRLRPEGNQGPICNALAAVERYYTAWGGPWDRLAWLKARAAAGDLALGRELIGILRPFVFPRSLQNKIIEQIKGLIHDIRRADTTREGWNVKLGSGGIRDVEFFVQALQLLHGGRDTTLQQRGTLATLPRLLLAGLISEQEHRRLAAAYTFWRRVEHRLQLHAGRQTHTLPHRGELRGWLAQHLAAHGDSLPDGLDATFGEEIADLRRKVSAVFATLGEAPKSASPLWAVANGTHDRAEAERIVEGLGFKAPPRAVDNLCLLADKPWGPLARQRTDGLAGALLAELPSAPDPDAALDHLVRLVLRVGPRSGIWRMLAQNRRTLRLLLNLFGLSDFLARLFVGQPEMLDQLLGAQHANPRPSRERLADELGARLADLPPDDVEQRLGQLCRWHREQLLRVGLCDIAGELAPEEVWTQLSHLAELTLDHLYPLVLSEMQRRYGTPQRADGRPAVMTVIGLGKLGSGEMTYASDLDLVFVHSDGGSSDGGHAIDCGEYFVRLAQRLIRALGTPTEAGPLYKVDMRLRPSGNQGTLVVSDGQFCQYHARGSAVWERQALVKARAVAGDRDLGRQLERWIRGHLYGEESTDGDLAGEVATLRQRIEQEKGKEDGRFFNLKQGRGGILDIDFLIQFKQLQHGHRYPELRLRAPLSVIPGLVQHGLLPAEHGEALAEAYLFLRRLEARLRMVRDRPAERLPREPEALAVLARALGHRDTSVDGAGQQLRQRYLTVTEGVRRLFEQSVITP